MRRRAHEQDGIALPVAVIVLSIVMLLTAVALLSAQSSAKRVNKDLEAKLALQAANSGLDLARDRLTPSKLTGALTVATPCVTLQRDAVSTVVTLVPSVVDSVLPGWCTPVVDRYANGSRSSYRLSTDGLVGSLLGGLLGLTGPRTVVSTGTYGSTTRKVAMTVEPTTTTQSYFGTYGISANKDVLLENGSTVESSVRSNQRIIVRLNLCGDLVTSGPGTNPVNDFDLGRGARYCGNLASAAPAGKITAATTKFNLPPVDYSSVRTLNNNLAVCGLPPLYIGGTAPGKCSGSLSGKPVYDTNYDYRTYTFPSGDYYFCNMVLNGGGLRIPDGAKVRIFIGSPEDCGGLNTNNRQFTKTNGFTIDNVSKDPSALQIYVAGSPTATTDGVVNQAPSGSSQDYMTIYAPNSDVVLDNDQRLNGAVVGDTVTIRGGGFVKTTSSTSSLGTAGSSTFLSSKFRECVKTSSSAPDAGCAIG